MRLCPRLIKCSVALTPPAQFVAPMLLTLTLGRLIGSITTKVSPAASNASMCCGVSMEVTTMAPWRPPSTRRRAQARPLPRKEAEDDINTRVAPCLRDTTQDFTEVGVSVVTKDELDRPASTCWIGGWPVERSRAQVEPAPHGSAFAQTHPRARSGLLRRSAQTPQRQRQPSPGSHAHARLPNFFTMRHPRNISTSAGNAPCPTQLRGKLNEHNGVTACRKQACTFDCGQSLFLQMLATFST